MANNMAYEQNVSNMGYHVKREMESLVKRGPTPEEVKAMKANPRRARSLGYANLLNEHEKRILRAEDRQLELKMLKTEQETDKVDCATLDREMELKRSA